jgi:hypothetical protein
MIYCFGGVYAVNHRSRFMAPDFLLAYWQVALALLFTCLTYVVTKGWNSRRLFYKLQRQGLVLLHPPRA